MAWYDRLTLGVLMVLCVALVGALMTLGNHVADLDDRMVGTTIVPAPTTTLPDERPCPVTFSDTYRIEIEECP